jgi:hypothetical protein
MKKKSIFDIYIEHLSKAIILNNPPILSHIIKNIPVYS